MFLIKDFGYIHCVIKLNNYLLIKVLQSTMDNSNLQKKYKKVRVIKGKII